MTSTSKIPKEIRKKLINNNWLRGVIHMPSNIFATTGTAVSIIFVDKSKHDDKIMLMDASILGTKTKLDSGQRTLLSIAERKKIVDMFKNRDEEPEFSVLVDRDKIKENKYITQAGQYVVLKENKLDFDIDLKLADLKFEIDKELGRNEDLNKEVKKVLEGI